ncbi:MAG: thermonuclease family protein [Clostridiales Family XIII bacterium]|nr:thermonuclease family protein [Clostridiales Family XIII bacterium]
MATKRTYSKKTSSKRTGKALGLYSLVIVAVAAVVGVASLLGLGGDGLKNTLSEMFGSLLGEEQTVSADLEGLTKAEVTKVADGDTFTIDTGDKVRLIGVDTPESVSPTAEKNVPFGKEASDYTKSQLLGKTVYLEFDVQEKDRYGRLLCYVYLADGTFYNLHLVEEGYARVMTVPPNVAHEEDFVAAEDKAKKAGLGVWEDYENIFPE